MGQRVRFSWFHYFINWILRWVMAHALRLDVQGLERTPKTGPVIVAINHITFIDPVFGCVYIRPDVVPMAKVELFRLPLGPLFRYYGAFPVRRGEGDLSALKRALVVLREGH